MKMGEDMDQNSNSILEEMELKMKQDSEDRSKILEEVARNMDVHSKKMVEYDQKAKALQLLQVKYQNLRRESEQALTKYQEQIIQLKESNASLENEVMVLKRSIINFKTKLNSLQSVVELMLNDFGIDQVSLATGLEKEKLKDLLQE